MTTEKQGTGPDPGPVGADNTTSIDGRGAVTDTIEARVARGVALLDKTLADWDQRIDLDRLNVRSECNCILAQEFAGHPAIGGLSGPFTVGADALFGTGATADDLAEYGFEEYSDEPEVDGYDALTAEWRRVILTRRGGAS